MIVIVFKQPGFKRNYYLVKVDLDREVVFF